MDLVSLLTSTTSKGNPNAWDISKAYYDAGADAWDISKAFYSSVSFSVAAQELTPTGLFFSTDGTQMYVMGKAGDDVNQYALSTPWLASSASYVRVFSISAQEINPEGLFFKPDGTKMYVTGSTGDDVNEYDLSTAWDISSASYLQNFSVATQETSPFGLFFKPDGTKMYVVGGGSGGYVNEYGLSTPWDVSSASYVQNFSVNAQDTFPQDLFFKPDGTKMYVVGSTNDRVYEYDLSTEWDISTASYVQFFSVAAQDATPNALFFRPDGSGFYVVGATNDTVYQYAIGGFSVAAQEVSTEGLFFKPDGTKMYVMGSSGDDVNEYDLSTAWDITTATYLQNFSVAAQETGPNGLFFKPDGTKMYVTGSTGDDVNEYDLSTPWDISTASYLQVFSIASQDTQPQALFFKPDGVKMYVVGVTSDSVHEYDLGTAWNVSTASFLQSFSVASQDSFPAGLFFKPDGTKMYVVGENTDIIYEYSLSSAWNISTASYDQDLPITTMVEPQNIFFKSDGTQFWLVDRLSDRVLSYLISPT